MVPRLLWEQEIAGSSPVTSTMPGVDFGEVSALVRRQGSSTLPPGSRHCSPIGRRRMVQDHDSVGSNPIGGTSWYKEVDRSST